MKQTVRVLLLLVAGVLGRHAIGTVPRRSLGGATA